jgi:hypothetical protein
MSLSAGSRRPELSLLASAPTKSRRTSGPSPARPIDKPLGTLPTSGFVPPTPASRHKPTGIRTYPQVSPWTTQRAATAGGVPKLPANGHFLLRSAERVRAGRPPLKIAVSAVQVRLSPSPGCEAAGSHQQTDDGGAKPIGYTLACAQANRGPLASCRSRLRFVLSSHPRGTRPDDCFHAGVALHISSPPGDSRTSRRSALPTTSSDRI